MIKVVISSQPRLLCILRAVVVSRSQATGIAGADADHLALAVDEAAANVIRHTYCGRHEGLMALEIRRLPDRLEFILQDWGPKVQEELIRPRPLNDLRPGGLGTFFIFNIMDAVSYDHDLEQGNRLRMVKFLPGKGGHEGLCTESG